MNCCSPSRRLPCAARSVVACCCYFRLDQTFGRWHAGLTMRTPAVAEGTPSTSARHPLRRRRPTTATNPSSRRRTLPAAWWRRWLGPSRASHAFVGATGGSSCAFGDCCFATSAEACCSPGGSPQDCAPSPSPWSGSAQNVQIPASWLVGGGHAQTVVTYPWPGNPKESFTIARNTGALPLPCWIGESLVTRPNE